MRRISVVGSSGAGKTTLARALAARLGLAHVELDSFYHQADWSHPSTEAFRTSVEKALTDAEASHGGWTLCGDYESQLEKLRELRSDTIVWVDLAKPLVMARLARRTVRRALTREELWNGNREPLTNFYRWDPEANVVRWSWTHFDERRLRFQSHIADGSWDHLRVVHLKTTRDAENFLGSLSPPGSLGPPGSPGSAA